jgi:mannosyl-oligosaccharide alpha-1,2-mannosidase
MKHAWDGYATTCFGQDEYMPLSKQCKDWLGEGVTIIDAMSTLHLMGFEAEFQRATEWIATTLNFNFSKDISFFETIIRIMGGLLSAYDFTGQQVFVDKAAELATALMPAFAEGRALLPYGKINLRTGAVSTPKWTGKSSILAEVSCYSVVTLLLHCCYTVVTLLLRCCSAVVTLLLHCCYTALTPLGGHDTDGILQVGALHTES